MNDPAFETPNTRSRRIRKDDPGSSSVTRPTGSQEDDRVIWLHDQRLRRAVLSATEHGTSIQTNMTRITGM